MRPGARFLRRLALAGTLAAATALAAVPAGYRYVGSRAVSDGRVAVFWYWNVEHVEIGPGGTSFVARMYARAVELNQERPYAAEIRCDSRTYREFGTPSFEAIDEGEPIHAVWRAGCRDGRAVPLAERNARLAATALPVEATLPPRAEAAPASPPQAAVAAAAAPVAAGKDAPADPRRVDACVRFVETKGAPAGDATIANACAFPVEVTLCYKGRRGGAYDCPAPPKGKRAESLAPGAVHVLPEYRRAAHKGVALVACRGTLGSVFPRLDEAGGGSGCY